MTDAKRWFALGLGLMLVGESCMFISIGESIPRHTTIPAGVFFGLAVVWAVMGGMLMRTAFIRPGGIDDRA